MTGIPSFDLDKTGKIDLHAIYDQPDPRAYYQTLFNLDYQIPAAAAPILRAVINAKRRATNRQKTTLVDVGSSYGVNAAILRHGIKLRDLFRVYSRETTKDLSRSALITRDRRLFSAMRVDKDLATIGLDVAGEALGYAEEVGVLDRGLMADLESRPPTRAEAEALAATDIVTSTGAIGYVGAPTFAHILDCADGAPWLALFALRMFPMNAISAMLKDRGHAVYRLANRTFVQRRFASKDEAREVLSRLKALGLDPKGLEAEGRYHAEFFFARSKTEEGPLPVNGLQPI